MKWYNKMLKRLPNWELADNPYVFRNIGNEKGVIITPMHGYDENAWLLAITKLNNKYYVLYSDVWIYSTPDACFDTEDEVITYINMVYY